MGRLRRCRTVKFRSDEADVSSDEHVCRPYDTHPYPGEIHLDDDEKSKVDT